MTDADSFVLGQLPASYLGKLVQIQYFLKVQVKHASWFEFGEGYEICIPIRLYQTPEHLCYVDEPNKF